MMNDLIQVDHLYKSQQYVFWCYSDIPGMLDILFQRVHGIVVKIHPKYLEYELDGTKRQLSLREIKNSSVEDGGAGTDVRPEVVIVLQQNVRQTFYPVNPLNPNSPLASAGEAHAMVKVINAFRKGEEVDLDPNPYHRELIRQGKAAKISKRYWDPYVSPWVYYAQDHPHYRSPLQSVLLAIIPGLILIVLGLIIKLLQ